MKFNDVNFSGSVLYFTGSEANDRLTIDESDQSGYTAFYNGGLGKDTLELSSTGRIYMTTFDQGATFSISAINISSSSDFAVGSIFTTSIERFVVKGSSLDDFLEGGSGNDYIDGRGGIDNFYGSYGDDTYVIDSSSERVFFEYGDMGTDQILTTVSVDLRQHSVVENLRLRGTDAIDGIGNGLANLITGNASSNVIAGGAGIDKLYGKGGADTFAFAEVGKQNKDSIWDFGADDVIRLTKSVFAGLDADNDGVLDAGAFHLGYKVTTAGAQILYDRTNGNLSYDADGVGGSATEVIAMVGKNLTFFDNADVLIA